MLPAQSSNADPRTYWDNLFRNGQVSFNKDASKLLQYAIIDRKPGSAIDLGMGEGRNAVFLASKGWRVTGVDFSAEAVKQAKLRAEAAHVLIDAVIALFYMHGWFHASKHDVPRILVDGLKPGGLLVIEGYAGDRRFDSLKIIHYEDVRDEADWAPGAKSQVVRFIAEKDGER